MFGKVGAIGRVQRSLQRMGSIFWVLVEAIAKFVERKREKKGDLLAIEEMRDRPIDGGEKLKKKGEWLVLVGKKEKRFPGKFTSSTLV